MMTLRLIGKSMLRRKTSTIIVTALSFCCAAFLCFYSNVITQLEANTNNICKEIPVTAEVANRSGSQTVGLKIDSNLIDKIDSLKLSETTLCTSNFVSFDGEHNEPKYEDYWEGDSLVSSNTLLTIAEVPSKDINFLDGYTADKLLGYSNICIMDETAMKRKELKLGDNYETTIYSVDHNNDGITFLRRVGFTNLKVIGALKSGTLSKDTEHTPEIFVPLPNIKKLCEENDVSLFYSAVKMKITNPLLLNDWKLAVSEKGFRETDITYNSVENDGGAMVVYDDVFKSAVTPVLRNLMFMKRLYPLIFLIVAFIGLLVSYLLVKNRKNEIAINRLLGMKKSKLFISMIIENLVPCGIGTVLCIFMISPFIHLNLTLLLSLGGYLFCYLFGCTAAILIINKVNVISILTTAE